MCVDQRCLGVKALLFHDSSCNEFVCKIVVNAKIDQQPEPVDEREIIKRLQNDVNTRSPEKKSPVSESLSRNIIKS